MKKNKQSFSSGDKYLLRIIMMYIALILLIVIVGFSMYAAFFNYIVASESETHQLRIRNAMTELERTLDEFDEFLLTLVNDDMTHFMSSPEPHVATMRELIESMRKLNDTAGLCSRYFLYSSVNGAVVEPLKGYMNPQIYYDSSFLYNDLSFAQWTALIRGTSDGLLSVGKTISPNEGFQNSLLYVRSYAIGTQKYGKAVFYIDANRLMGQFSEALNAHYPCYVELIDNRSQTLFTFGEAESSQLADRLYSKKHGFTLNIAYSPEHLRIYAIDVVRPLFIIIMLFMALSISFVLVIWHSHHVPLRKTVSQLPQISMDGNTLDYLPNAVSILNQHNQDLVEQKRSQLHCIETVAMHRILSGNPQADPELKLLLEQINIHVTHRYCRGTILKVMGDISVQQQSDIESFLRSYNNEHIRFLTLSDINAFALLVESEETSREAVLDALNSLYCLLCQRGIEPVCFYVGIVCTDISELPRSLHTANEQLLSNGEEKTEKWIVFSDDVSSTKSYRLSEQQIRSLLIQSRAGNNEDVILLLRKIRDENVSSSSFGRRLLTARLVDILLEAGYSGPLDENIRWQLFSLHFFSFFEILEGYFDTLCTSMRQIHATQASQFSENIVATMKNEFSNPDLSLSEIAYRFGVSEKHISNTLRKETGLTFQGYLEKLRIDRANQLLLADQLNIAQIAASTGYANDRTFRRAYVRVMGYPPSEYKKYAENSIITDAGSKEDI